jgi:hypothetical protein
VSAPRLPLIALRLYPSWWRERRGEEVAALLEDGAVTGLRVFWAALDLAWHGLALQLRGTGIPMLPDPWRHRTQEFVLLATIPWLLALPFSGPLASGVSMSRDPDTPMPFAIRVVTTCAAVSPLVLAAIFIVLTWGWGALRSDAAAQRRGWARVRATAMCLSPLFAAAAAISMQQLGTWFSPHVVGSVSYYMHGVLRHHMFYARGGHPALGQAFAVITPVVGCIALLASAYLLVRIACATRWDAESIRRGIRISTAVSMLGFFAAIVTTVRAIATAAAPAASLHSSEWSIWDHGVTWWLAAAFGYFLIACLSYGTSRAGRRARDTWVRLASVGGATGAA